MNAWVVACRKGASTVVEMDLEYEDFDIPSFSGDSGDYPFCDGWADHSSENKDDHNDEGDEEDKDKREDTCKSSKAKNVKKKRPRRRCPLKGCKAEVIDIPRHLREVREWSKDIARNATSRYGVRKSFEPKPEKTKSDSSHGKKKYTEYHRHRACPIQGCRSVVKRLLGHIRQVHQDIPIGSPLYKKILKEARSAKTWKPLEEVECCSREDETEPKHCSLDESENEEDMTNDAEPSERPSADEEYAIMEAAEEANSSNVEEEITVVSSFCSLQMAVEKTRNYPSNMASNCSVFCRQLAPHSSFNHCSTRPFFGTLF